MKVESTRIQERRNFFNRAAKNWNDSPTPQEATFLRSVILKATTSPEIGKRVLDVGCGSGILFPFLKEWEVVALDFSEEMLNCAKVKHTHDDIQYICEDAQALSFPAEYFAKALMLAVFPHFDDPLKAMREIYRVLKPDGVTVIIHLKDAVSINSVHASIGDAIGNDFLPDAEALQTIIREAGFTICHSEFDGRIAVICRKPRR